MLIRYIHKSMAIFVAGVLILLFSCSSANPEKEAQMDQKLTFLALGDSYTIGESVKTNERWPNQLVDSLAVKGINFQEPKIIATTGWRTDELKAAILEDGDKKYDMVSLLIGVNDQYQKVDFEKYKPQFIELLEMAIEKASGKKDHVFVVSIPDYGFTPFGAKNKDEITKELDEYNRVNKEMAERFGVKYFNITDISRNEDPSFVANDGLHPSGTQYSRWVSLIMQDLDFFKAID